MRADRLIFCVLSVWVPSASTIMMGKFRDRLRPGAATSICWAGPTSRALGCSQHHRGSTVSPTSYYCRCELHPEFRLSPTADPRYPAGYYERSQAFDLKVPPIDGTA